MTCNTTAQQTATKKKIQTANPQKKGGLSVSRIALITNKEIIRVIFLRQILTIIDPPKVD